MCTQSFVVVCRMMKNEITSVERFHQCIYYTTIVFLGKLTELFVNLTRSGNHYEAIMKPSRFRGLNQGNECIPHSESYRELSSLLTVGTVL